jgi:hypothetical protein
MISLSDFNTLSQKDKKKTLEELKKEIGVSGIAKEWDISRSKTYSLLHEFNISVGSKGRTKLKKPIKPSENIKATSTKDNDKQNNSSAEKAGQTTNKSGRSESSLSFDTQENDSKFSIYLETQGDASFINETVQHLLQSEKLASSKLHLNISLQEV